MKHYQHPPLSSSLEDYDIRSLACDIAVIQMSCDVIHGKSLKGFTKDLEGFLSQCKSSEELEKVVRKLLIRASVDGNMIQGLLNRSLEYTLQVKQ